MRTRRSAVLALAASAALAIGVTAAWAGFPNMRIADSTFTEGTVTKGGGKTTTSSRTLAAVAPSAAQTYSPATIYVHFRATGVNEPTTFAPYAEGTQSWACANWGGGWPDDPRKFGSDVVLQGDDIGLSYDKNGRIIYTGDQLELTLSPPSTFVCPSGQTALLVGLSLMKLELWATVDGVIKKYDVDSPTSAGWVGDVYTRAGYPG
jgi:hypothetical protein